MTRQRLAFSLIFVGACLLVLIFGLWLSAGAVDAQATAPAPTPTPLAVTIDPESGATVVLPSGSPWWAAIAASVVGLGIWIVRSQFNRRDKACDLKLKQQDQEFQLQLEQLKNKSIADSAGAVQTESLAQSLLEMAQITNKLHSTLQERIDTQDEQLTESNRLRDKNSEAQLKVAEAQERTALILSDIETRQEARQGRSDAVGLINAHTTAAIESIKEPLERAVSDLDAARQNLNIAIDRDDMKELLEPMEQQLATLTAMIRAILEHAGVSIPVVVEPEPPNGSSISSSPS